MTREGGKLLMEVKAASADFCYHVRGHELYGKTSRPCREVELGNLRRFSDQIMSDLERV